MHTQQGQCRGTLSWSNRLSIALDIARALEYLHTIAEPPVIHRDIKSSNILLVNNNHAKLADFGLCKLGHDIQTAPLTPTTIKGSLGYVDTNYLNTGLLSPKSDVYSFGVILLELVTGLKSLQGSTTIAEWTEDCRKNQNVDVLAGLLDRSLPTSLRQLLQLQSLHLNNNNISGEIPIPFKNLTNLQTLDLGDNRLSGTIPSWLGDGYTFTSLGIIKLRSNAFFGAIPAKLSKLSSLATSS